jgi:hypothetical protein
MRDKTRLPNVVLALAVYVSCGLACRGETPHDSADARIGEDVRQALSALVVCTCTAVLDFTDKEGDEPHGLLGGLPWIRRAHVLVVTKPERLEASLVFIVEVKHGPRLKELEVGKGVFLRLAGEKVTALRVGWVPDLYAFSVNACDVTVVPTGGSLYPEQDVGDP